MRSSTIYLCSTAAFALVFAASPGLAAADPAAVDAPAVPPADDANQLKDIIITATRAGETNLQNTPIAVTALSGRTLAERGVTSALDLNGLAPNVSIGGRSGAGATAGSITIRGIGTDANAPAQPGVGIYVDEVYIPAQRGNLLGAFDLAQVEILRGPAGTTFGRNTIGGAVQYTSVKPVIGEFSGFVEGTGGNQRHYDISGGVNVPIADWAALRVSGTRTSIDGYVYNIANNIYRGSADNGDVRVQLLLKPVEDLTINLKVEQLTQNSNGPSATQIGFNARPGPPTPNSVYLALLSPDYYTSVGTNQPESFKAKMKIAQGVISYKITPNITAKSITAYSENTDLLLVDADGTTNSYFANSQGTDVNKLFTQEFQLLGNSFNDRLHWSLGAYYYDEDTSRIGAAASSNGGPFQNNTFGNYDVKTKSYAEYGQATFNLTERLSLLAGLRHTYESNRVTDSPDTSLTSPTTTTPGFFLLYTAGAQPSFRPPAPAPGGLAVAPFTPKAYSAASTSNNWSPLVGFNFQATDDILLYGKWSRGFRGSGFSPTLYSPTPFAAETAETYEAGLRTEFFDHRVRVNPTIFFTDWNNIQFNGQSFFGLAGASPAVAPIVFNAGRARAKGFEIETQFQVTRHFTLTANGALFDAHYTYIAPALASAIPLNAPLARSPKSSFAVGGRYDVPLGNGGKFTMNANYVWQAHQRAATTDTSNGNSSIPQVGIGLVEIPAYGLLNARVGYTAPGGAYSVAVYSNNLFDQKYAISGVNYVGSPTPTVQRDVGRPRQFGVTLRANFK